MIDIQEYITSQGRSPFNKWFSRLDQTAASKVAHATYLMRQGHLSNVKSVGKGVFEFRIHYGPGYRIYFGKDGDKIIILLGGGDKSSQRRDIELAHKRWNGYKLEKDKER